MLTILTYATPAAAGAQHADSRIVSGAFERLRPRTLVRVSVGGERYIGRHLSATADSLVLSTPDPWTRRHLALADVDTLWVHRGSHVKSMALVGGVLVGFLAALGGAVACGSSEGICTNVGLACASSLGVGAAFGGAVGGLFGATLPRWYRSYPPASPPASHPR